MRESGYYWGLKYNTDTQKNVSDCDCGYDGAEDECKLQPSAVGNAQVLIIIALGYYSFYTMTANIFVDLKVFPAVVYTQHIRREVRRKRKICYTAEGHRFVTAEPLFFMTE